VEVEVTLADGQTVVVETAPQSEADRAGMKGATVSLSWDGAHTLVFAA
jgi:hypothetical protein